MNIALEPYWHSETTAHRYLRLAEQAVVTKKPKYPQIVEALLDAAWEVVERTGRFFDLINPAHWNAGKLQADPTFRPSVSVNMRINQSGNLSVTWSPFPKAVLVSDEFEPRYLHECEYVSTATSVGGRPRGELMYFRNAIHLRNAVCSDSDFYHAHRAEMQILFALRAAYATMLKRLRDALSIQEATAFEEVFGLKPDESNVRKRRR